LLCLGLREAFLDGGPNDDRTAAFADIYRRLALPGMEGEAREQAQAIVDSIAQSA
jgi:hypothetical protein